MFQQKQLLFILRAACSMSPLTEVHTSHRTTCAFICTSIRQLTLKAYEQQLVVAFSCSSAFRGRQNALNNHHSDTEQRIPRYSLQASDTWIPTIPHRDRPHSGSTMASDRASCHQPNTYWPRNGQEQGCQYLSFVHRIGRGMGFFQ
jgi:hypothetical protein